jgi:hypothetical protein
MVLGIFAFILLGIFGLIVGIWKMNIVEQSYKVLLNFATEVQQPLDPNILVKAVDINDLNTLARQFCERGQAMVIQCIERHITNPNAILSPFCQSVVNQVQAGHDLTTDVQYLWGYLPRTTGQLRDLYIYYSTTTLTTYTDLQPYLRYIWRRDIPTQYQTYFWVINLADYYYHKPEDSSNPTPCAYTGVIIPPY